MVDLFDEDARIPGLPVALFLQSSQARLKPVSATFRAVARRIRHLLIRQAAIVVRRVPCDSRSGSGQLVSDISDLLDPGPLLQICGSA
jgi:hypothetical protein